MIDDKKGSSGKELFLKEKSNKVKPAWNTDTDILKHGWREMQKGSHGYTEKRNKTTERKE